MRCNQKIINEIVARLGGISDAELAKTAGVKGRSIANWRKDDAEFSVQWLGKLCEKHDWDLHQLTMGTYSNERSLRQELEEARAIQATLAEIKIVIEQIARDLNTRERGDV